MKAKTNIYERHTENAEWAEKLFFYKDEIAIMQERLDEVIRKNSGLEVKMRVEHFQNQLIIKKSTIEMLQESIEGDELIFDVEVDTDVLPYKNENMSHKKIEAEIRDFERNFRDFRKELHEFLAKWI